MAFIIRANNKDYIVSDHAARRMVQRYIGEDIIIETLENGTITEQLHGTELYEHEIYDEILEAVVIVHVVVDAAARTIISVIDSTEDE